MRKQFARWLGVGLLLRRALRALNRIDHHLAEQNRLLARLVDEIAPMPPAVDDAHRATVRGDTGVSFLDPDEVVLATAYIARVERDTGHVPDEEEVLVYLADEKTIDLHQRLAAREAEIERLSRERGGR